MEKIFGFIFIVATVVCLFFNGGYIGTFANAPIGCAYFIFFISNDKVLERNSVENKVTSILKTVLMLLIFVMQSVI